VLRVKTIWRGTRIVAETAIGYLLLVAGLVMLVTPGPGIVTVIAGLAVLSRHFHWAERLKRASLARVRDSRTALQARRADRRASGTRASADLGDTAEASSGPSDPHRRAA
jgi:UPF0716 family protein affecting phage T7 exclusion